MDRAEKMNKERLRSLLEVNGRLVFDGRLVEKSEEKNEGEAL